MLTVDRTPARPRDVVNLAELAEVRQHHLPTVQVQFAPLGEVARRAAEVARQHPRLREEAAFVVAEETRRRYLLAGPVLTLHQ